jgi:hypothetical protein
MLARVEGTQPVKGTKSAFALLTCAAMIISSLADVMEHAAAILHVAVPIIVYVGHGVHLVDQSQIRIVVLVGIVLALRSGMLRSDRRWRSPAVGPEAATLPPVRGCARVGCRARAQRRRPSSWRHLAPRGRSAGRLTDQASHSGKMTSTLPRWKVPMSHATLVCATLGCDAVLDSLPDVRQPCPQCGGQQRKPIAYGFRTDDTSPRVVRGEGIASGEAFGMPTITVADQDTAS